MTKIRSKIKHNIVAHVVKHRQSRKQLPAIYTFIVISFTLAVGYVAGCYNNQIMAAIGPVFGYKAHSGYIDLSSLQQTYNKLAANYDGTLNTDELIQGANRGMVEATGDTYTKYFSPKEAIEFNNGLNGTIGGGIGAVITLKDNNVIVSRPLKDNPAEKAGLKADDIILKINDQSTSGWTVEKAVNLIRGEVGTTVKLSIQRGTEIKDYTVTRASITSPSIESSITDGVGTMSIYRFDDETGGLARAIAQDFKTQGVKSVILDLRGNPGGYVDSAIDIASLWLNDKVVVVERSGDVVKETLKSGRNAILAGIPTIVLVDGGSASASEIVAGALQDHGVAKLVGGTTYGKGSVQLPMKLDGGAEIKVTVAKWYTPKGKNIDKEGIKPDVIVEFTKADVDGGTDPQITEAKRLLNL